MNKSQPSINNDFKVFLSSICIKYKYPCPIFRSQDGSIPFEHDAMKRAAMKSMLEQHAMRLKRGGFNSGFAHALRVRRGGIGQRSSWGHALRVRSSNMLNRGHALRIKRKPSDYRAFALRVRKNDNSFADDISEDPGKIQ